MQNVLVTGGAGFIGSNFVQYLIKQHPEVRIINLDALTYAGSLENLREVIKNERHVFVHGDICNSTLVNDIFSRYQVETVVHFAAETHVDRSISGPEQFIQTNIVGTFTLLEAARKYWLINKSVDPHQARFHHVSTDEVYGSLNQDDPAWTEAIPYSPNSPYSASKASSDHLVRAYHHTYGLPITITNCSNNYGPRQFPEKLIPLMILNALNGKDLPVYGDGQQMRDWLYVEDHCEAINIVLERGQNGETFNIGGDNQTSNLSIVQKICEILDELKPQSTNRPYSSLIKFVVDRPGHDRRYAMDIGKISNELGWKPRQSFSDGLLKTVKWYLDNPEWVNLIHNRTDYQTWINENYILRGGQKK
jgi:dTDP-glucose 4,6-dehydratase